MPQGPTRRTFLKHASLLGALPLLPLAGAPREPTPFPYFDGLCFLPPDRADLARSGLSGFLLDVSAGQTVWRGGERHYVRDFESCARSITAMRRELREIDGAFLALKGGRVRGAHGQGKIAVFFQFQGCEPIGEDLTRMELFYELGLRVLQLTHHHDNAIAGGGLEPETTGLTKLGFEAVEQMDELGLVPDLSHSSDETAKDVLKTSKKPVIVSHGACRALVENARCAPDEVIRGVGESGGVMGIFMMSFWLTTERVPKVEHLVAQIRHVVDVGGIEAVGIANDFPVSGEQTLAGLDNDNAAGVKNYLPWWQSMAKRGILGFDETPRHVVIPELNDARRMFTLHAALEESGLRAPEIEKIMGGNWIRVLTESLG